MNICFYDNREITPDENGNVSIDRVYCLEFHDFKDVTWQHLGEVYRSLPQYIVKDNACPMWYGEEEGSAVYLYASVEPSGLQIVGDLSAEQWEMWERMFHRQLSRYDFPSFEC
ncbi:hypothetical protein SAMN05661091_5525 [Paenibacillus uliginis N3/975]|uniref:Uncharacterized protein n=1 Tax=Paenibacillus uliginis N3/975 TaxID=1313296 RepID=A0A1X7HRG5_9BACL|nr:hypothetical protein [Paenibacillus uliginis]SMF91648.1 hypothetical protein SAMN05661091_5525 [Paenibacillus uliginis N3/975]